MTNLDPHTVVVFSGSPTSDHLIERYRRTFGSLADAQRHARQSVTLSRSNPQTGAPYVFPAASIFEGHSDKLGAHVEGFESRARKRYLAKLSRQAPVYAAAA